MIETITYGFAVFGVICVVLMAGTIGFALWDIRELLRLILADLRKGLAHMFGPAAKPSKAPVGYDHRRGAETTTKADAPPDSTC